MPSDEVVVDEVPGIPGLGEVATAVVVPSLLLIVALAVEVVPLSIGDTSCPPGVATEGAGVAFALDTTGGEAPSVAVELPEDAPG